MTKAETEPPRNYKQAYIWDMIFFVFNLAAAVWLKAEGYTYWISLVLAGWMAVCAIYEYDKWQATKPPPVDLEKH